MPYFSTSQEWLTQSTLLLEARPSTTRITTKYTVPSASTLQKRQAKNKRSTKSNSKEPSADTASEAQPAPKALLTLKTYDPVSGACLKYQTDKQQEVGRLVAGLGRLGRGMAALPPAAEESVVPEATGAEGGSEVTAKVAAEPGKQQQGGGGGGGGKKKKKGKR